MVWAEAIHAMSRQSEQAERLDLHGFLSAEGLRASVGTCAEPTGPD